MLRHGFAGMATVLDKQAEFDKCTQSSSSSSPLPVFLDSLFYLLSLAFDGVVWYVNYLCNDDFL